MSYMSESNVCRQILPADLAAHSAKTILLDVRSPIEFETEHIPDSVNVPLDEIEARCNEVPREGQLVVVCRSGKRAERAAYTLLGKGFHPTVLKGGLLAWREAGLPVKEGKKMLSIERQIQLTVGIGVLTGVLLAVFISPWFLVIPAFFGAGLTFAGLSGTCALGLLLMRAPWNQLPVTNTTASGENSKAKSSCCN